MQETFTVNLPEGVQPDPFNIYDCGFVADKYGNIFHKDDVVAYGKIPISARPGYMLVRGKGTPKGSVQKIATERVRVEFDRPLDWSWLESVNYAVGINEYKHVEGTIDVSIVPNKEASVPVAPEKTWEGMTNTEILQGILDSIGTAAKRGRYPKWMFQAVLSISASDGMNIEETILYAWKNRNKEVE